MALFHSQFYSTTLQMASSMTVILPQGARPGDNGFPTLMLLHGLSDNHSNWLRWTSLERYVEGLGLAVVMPEVHRGFYTDIDRFRPYWTFISEELPQLARSFFPLSARREDNFAAGLSMGGYGAFKLGLRCPDRYAAVASLSGALDANDAYDFMGEEAEIVFNGKTVNGTDNDLFVLAERMAGGTQPKPRLYQCCGTEDFLYPGNLKFLSHARALGLDLDYEEEPGDHNWNYWDMKIKRVLEWLPIQKPE